MAKEENKDNLEDFASAMGSAFDIEVSKESIEEQKIEKPFAEEKLEDILTDWDDEELEDYESPMLKKLLTFGKGVCKGNFSDGEFKKVIKEIEAELDKNIKDFSFKKETIETFTFTEREQIVRITRAFSLHKEALEEIYEYFEDDDTDHILDGLEMAQSAVNRLYKSFILLNEAKKSAGNKSKNLYLIDKKESEVDLVMGEQKKYYTTPNFERLKEEVALLKGGKITQEKFSSTLDWMMNNIEKARKENKKIKSSSFPEEELKAADDKISSAEEALVTYEKGIKEMGKYLTDGKAEHLDNGLVMAFKATQVIVEIQHDIEEVEES